MGHRLTLISAPAGFGKTTLLSEWIHLRSEVPPSLQVAWLSLDEGDNDPARFLAYLIAAFQKVEENIGAGALGALQSPQPPPMEELLAALINQINAIPDDPSTALRQGSGQGSGRSFILVLDDYHLVTAQPVHDALRFLLDHLPGKMHLVIASRADPPLPIARLRGRGQLTELRLTDLRFTPDEAAAFLNQVMDLGLSAEDVAALASRTEGWIAGLQMAAVSMQRREDITGFIQAFTGSNRYILDYLVEEVLQRQPESVQTFLLQTSILDQLTGPLCDAVTGQDDGQVTLEMLEQANLFIVPLDDERSWYRYHRLFADLLRKRLHRTQPDLVPTLHRRASAWYEQNELMAAAIDHALSAGDFERAAHLIEQVAEKTLMRSEIITFMRWAETLPDELVRTRPLLCVYHAVTLLLTGRSLDAVEARLQDAVKADPKGSASGEVAASRALIAAYQGDTRHGIELSHRALELLPEESFLLRNMVAGSLGLIYIWSGDLAAATRTFEEGARMAQKSGNLLFTVIALRRLGRLHMSQGQLHEARALYEHALEMAVDRQGQPLPIAGIALMGLGELWREWNDLEAATRYLVEGIELSRQWGEVMAVDGYISLARVKQAQGDKDGVRDALEKAQQLAIRTESTEIDDLGVALYRARLWIAQGNLELALRWVEERGLDRYLGSAALEASDDLLSHHLRRHEHLVLARLLIAQGRPAEVPKLLEPLLREMEREGRTGTVIEIQVLKALAFQAQGDSAQALTSLAHALSLAEPGGYLRIFVDEGTPMMRLLYQAAERGIAPEYTGRLLAAFPDSEFEPAASSETEKLKSQMVEPLSERELEVLQLIAEGFSNQEVAQQLVLSLPTVKWHTSNIYGKLGVKNRTQAVAKARALGILPIT